MIVIKRLKELRISHNLNMREVAQKLNIPYTTYVNYEKESREPNIETLILIADFFGVTIDYLIGKESANNKQEDNFSSIPLTTREIFQENLKHYIEMTAKTKKQISEEMGIPYTTLMDWVNGNKFPRADGIEKLANYFKILKSDLFEEKQVDNQKKQFLDRLMKSAYCLSKRKIELLIQIAENMSGNIVTKEQDE